MRHGRRRLHSLAVAIQFADMKTTTAAILVMGFLFLTAPIAAHMIGRAAYRHQTPKWTGTHIDASRSFEGYAGAEVNSDE